MIDDIVNLSLLHLYLINCPFTVKVLQGLWRNDLVALKGACPNCGEEVSHCDNCPLFLFHSAPQFMLMFPDCEAPHICKV